MPFPGTAKPGHWSGTNGQAILAGTHSNVFHQATVSLDCDQATMVTQHGKPMFTKVTSCLVFDYILHYTLATYSNVVGQGVHGGSSDSGIQL